MTKRVIAFKLWLYVIFSTGNNSDGFCNNIFGLSLQNGIDGDSIIGLIFGVLLNEISVTGEYTEFDDDIYVFMIYVDI